jgi:hypothetical protein
VERLAGILDPLHHFAVTAFGENQMAQQPMSMIASADSRRNERCRLQIVKQRKDEPSSLSICQDENGFRLHG